MELHRKLQLKTVVLHILLSGVIMEMVEAHAGYNSISMNIAKLSAGTYNIYGITEDGKSAVIRFVKR